MKPWPRLAWATNLEKQKQLGAIKNAKVRTVQDLILDYMPRAEMTDSGRWNKLRLLKFCEAPLAEVKLDEVTPHHINEWITNRLTEVKPGTVNRELNLWRSVFTHGVHTRKWLESNPCRDSIKPPAGARRDRTLLTPAEIEAIAVATGYHEHSDLSTKLSRVGACFFLAMETALRSGEILHMRPQDYNRNDRTLYVHALERGGSCFALRRQACFSAKSALITRIVPIQFDSTPGLPGVEYSESRHPIGRSK